jgi:hypothetical protein
MTWRMPTSNLTGPILPDRRWLLVKMADEQADARRKPVKSQPESVVSGRTIEEVAAEAQAGKDLRG